MPGITAEFQERKRVVFTSRGRSLVNVRQALEDGPIGFTSVELLLISLGNCSLGSLLNHPLLKNESVYEAVASLEIEQATEPDRVSAIHWDIRLVVEDESIVQHCRELEEIALSGPACSSVSAELSAKVTIWTQRDVGPRFLPPLADADGASCEVDFAPPTSSLSR